MSDDHAPTVRIRRPARVTTDARGRSVWEDTIDTVELELVSTAELQAILDSGDEASRGAIREAVADSGEGVLARDPATGLFRIISDEDLKAMLDVGDDDLPAVRRTAEIAPEPPSGAERGDELSLVSTQLLRKIIQPDQPPADRSQDTKPAAPRDRSGGFDPYNSG